MALSDLYVLDHKQSYLNEPIHNIYTFEALGTGSSTDLVNAFQADILPKVQALQSDDIRTDSLLAYNLGSLADIDEKTINTLGLTTEADMLPIFNAVNFTFKPASRAVRPGSKRIAGIPESAQTDGRITLAGYITAMETLRTAFGNEISTDETNFYRFVVVKRIKYVPEGNPPDKFAYRFPTAEDTLVFAPLRNVTTTLKISHQVSRGN